MAMSPPSTVHGGQHDIKYVTYELLLHAAFVAGEIWGFTLEPARIRLFEQSHRLGSFVFRTQMLYSLESCGCSRISKRASVVGGVHTGTARYCKNACGSRCRLCANVAYWDFQGAQSSHVLDLSRHVTSATVHN